DYCDPNGESPSSHGLQQTAVEYMRSIGVMAVGARGGNDPTVRDHAIQCISGRMFRQQFRIHPRCVECERKGGLIERRESRLVVAALQSGYVWSDKKHGGQSAPNVRIPQKGTRYDHTMNCVEYLVVGTNVPSRPTARVLDRAKAKYGSLPTKADERRQHAE